MISKREKFNTQMNHFLSRNFFLISITKNINLLLLFCLVVLISILFITYTIQIGSLTRYISGFGRWSFKGADYPNKLEIPSGFVRSRNSLCECHSYTRALHFPTMDTSDLPAHLESVRWKFMEFIQGNLSSIDPSFEYFRKFQQKNNLRELYCIQNGYLVASLHHGLGNQMYANPLILLMFAWF